MVSRVNRTTRLAPTGRAGRRLRRLVARRFGRDASGVSAIEFALIAPIMIALFLGGVEISNALTVQRKVTSVTSSLSDLVTQAKTISDDDIDNILDIASTIISPYDENRLRIKVSGIAIDSKGRARVKWSDALNDQPLAKDSQVALPSGVKEKDSFLVATEVHYNFKPTIGYVLTGNIDLNDDFYMRPRLSSEVTRVP